MDQTEDGRRLRAMPVVAECARECLALEVERSITAEDVGYSLERLFTERGEPDYIRSDDDPRFIAEAVKRWLASSGVRTLYMKTDAPQENVHSTLAVATGGCSESWLPTFHPVYRTLPSAPHGALGYLTPTEFAAIDDLWGQTSGATERSEELEFVPRLS